MFYRNQIKELEQWRRSPSRKPLMIRGARQVGKTTLIHEFGKQFDQYIFLNLEHSIDAELFDEFDDIHQLITRIFLEKGMQLNALEQTLLFIDEIQESPKVVNLLRYFKEEIPRLAVIAAGSMLETLLGKNLTFPVGRVEYKVLRPVSFEEFLKATSQEQLLEEYLKTPIEQYAEKALLRAFHTYALLGGMPEIIQHYSENRDATALAPIYDALISSYLEDAEKYAKSEQQLQLIRFCIHQAMLKAGQRTTFQRFGNSNYPSKAIGEVLRALEKTHLLTVLYPVTGTKLPLEPDHKKTPRIQFLDSGLINFFVGLQQDIIATGDLDKVYNGTLIEHLVGQELLSFQSLTLNKLHFWVRQKKQSDAEIDFLYPYKGKLIPIEVKSGATGTLKSLQVFMDQSPLHFAIRFYAGKRQIDLLRTKEGKSYYLLSLPYFLGARIESYLDWMIQEIGDAPPEIQTFEEAAASYRTQRVEKKALTLDELSAKHIKLLRFCKDEPKKGERLLTKGLGLSYQSRNKRVYIKPLMNLDLLEFTIPEYEKSKKQRYRITAKGKAFLKTTLTKTT
jgi:predicted AAA+ superfamily ATPase/predicted transcriptional regulator